LTRFPHDPEYVARLGAAVYAFAYLEWLLIEILGLIDPSTGIRETTAGSSGRRASRLDRALKAAALPSDVDLGIGHRFLALVSERNDIIHAHPATDAQAGQRLYRWAPHKGKVAFVSDATLTAFIQAVEDLTQDANRLREYLKAHHPEHADKPPVSPGR
jgi:hypothetical protein